MRRCSLLRRWCDAPQFVEEVEDEGNLVELLFGRAGGDSHGQSFTVRMEIESARKSTRRLDRLFRPEPRLVRFERIAFDNVRRHHNSIVETMIKKLAAG